MAGVKVVDVNPSFFKSHELEEESDALLGDNQIIFQAWEEVVFGSLSVINDISTKAWTSRKEVFVIALMLILEELQLLAFLMEDNITIWPSIMYRCVEYFDVHNVIVSFNFDTVAVAVMVVAGTVLILVLSCMIVYVGLAFKSGAIRHLWPVKFLQMFMAICCHTFFIR
eukprot:Colp12_sorted_trinity150504_noHs@26661